MDAKDITKMSEVDSITPSQLMISSCTGALLTSFFGMSFTNFMFCLY